MKKVILSNNVLLGEVERLLRNGTTVTIRTKGNSMLPFIVGERDSVVLVPYSERPNVGDIALAHLNNNVYVLHRIISISENENVILMGDGNLKGTEYCQIKDLCGKSVIIIRKNKKVNTSSFIFILLSRIWRILLPCRRILLAVYKRFLIKTF